MLTSTARSAAIELPGRQRSVGFGAVVSALRCRITHRDGQINGESNAGKWRHQSALLKELVENGLVNTVHIPKRLEIARMTEHTQKTPDAQCGAAREDTGELPGLCR